MRKKKTLYPLAAFILHFLLPHSVDSLCGARYIYLEKYTAMELQGEEVEAFAPDGVNLLRENGASCTVNGGSCGPLTDGVIACSYTRNDSPASDPDGWKRIRFNLAGPRIIDSISLRARECNNNDCSGGNYWSERFSYAQVRVEQEFGVPLSVVISDTGNFGSCQRKVWQVTCPLFPSVTATSSSSASSSATSTSSSTTSSTATSLSAASATSSASSSSSLTSPSTLSATGTASSSSSPTSSKSSAASVAGTASSASSPTSSDSSIASITGTASSSSSSTSYGSSIASITGTASSSSSSTSSDSSIVPITSTASSSSTATASSSSTATSTLSASAVRPSTAAATPKPRKWVSFFIIFQGNDADALVGSMGFVCALRSAYSHLSSVPLSAVRVVGVKTTGGSFFPVLVSQLEGSCDSSRQLSVLERERSDRRIQILSTLTAEISVDVSLTTLSSTTNAETTVRTEIETAFSQNSSLIDNLFNSTIVAACAAQEIPTNLCPNPPSLVLLLSNAMDGTTVSPPKDPENTLVPAALAGALGGVVLVAVVLAVLLWRIKSSHYKQAPPTATPGLVIRQISGSLPQQFPPMDDTLSRSRTGSSKFMMKTIVDETRYSQRWNTGGNSGRRI